MKTYKFEPIKGRGQAASLWLVLNMITDAVALAVGAFGLNRLARLETLTDAEIRQWEMVDLATWPGVAVYYITVIVVAFWIHRASANAHSLRSGLETSPPWAVGWYCIPFANLWMPLKAMKEIWRASFARAPGQATPSDNVLGGWWAFWLITTIAGNISSRMINNATDPSTYVISSWLAIISAITGILAAWTLRTIVRRITAAQTAAHKVRSELPAQPDAPEAIALAPV
jgi:hypothetical protein